MAHTFPSFLQPLRPIRHSTSCGLNGAANAFQSCMILPFLLHDNQQQLIIYLILRLLPFSNSHPGTTSPSFNAMRISAFCTLTSPCSR